MPSLTLDHLAHLTGGYLARPDSAGVCATDVVIASGQVEPGSLFVAIPGGTRNGHLFVDDAFQRGAVACVVQDPLALKGRHGIVVESSRRAASALAAEFNAHPSRELVCCGVTGTNGKTTIHWLLFQAFEALGLPALRVGTIGFAAPNIFEADTLTTPDAVSLQRMLRRGLHAGAKAACMEIGSHALDQHRADDVHLDVAIYTNLTLDHLDYHGTMECYFAAKRRIFAILKHSAKRTKCAVINRDDPYGARYAAAADLLDLPILTYGQAPEADLRIESIEQSPEGSEITLLFRGKRIATKSPLVGRYNGYNIAAVIAALCSLGHPIETICKIIPALKPVPGRLEPVHHPEIGVYVDYAHTPDALENVLTALRDITRGNLWVVFGCGGDRDRSKRPIMGQIARRLADRVVVTSDNPRTEEPTTILDQVSAGAHPDHREIDRRKAIQFAIHNARPGDVIVIAGKGHEDYQIIGTTKYPFSDQAEARAALASRSGDKDD